MTTGVPMPMEVQEEVRQMVERAAGAEVVRAIRESQRETREMWAHMTSDEIADWIMGVEH